MLCQCFFLIFAFDPEPTEADRQRIARTELGKCATDLILNQNRIFEKLEII